MDRELIVIVILLALVILSALQTFQLISIKSVTGAATVSQPRTPTGRAAGSVTTTTLPQQRGGC